MKKLLLILPLLTITFFTKAQYSSEIDISKGASGPVDIITADLNGDGFLDIVSASKDDNKIAWYQNLGNLNFSNQIIISENIENLESIHSVDIDNDGDIDILSASFNDDKLALYENLGGGNFEIQQVISYTTDGPVDIISSDIDNDGLIDIISISGIDNTLAWHKNLGNNSFGLQNVISTSLAELRSVYSSDFDNDGDYDIFVTSYGTPSGTSGPGVFSFENLGSGTFSAFNKITSGFYYQEPEDAVLSDMDGDGIEDIIVGFHSYGGYTGDVMLYNNNAGLFSQNYNKYNITNGDIDNIQCVNTSDIDNDGDLDIIISSFNDNKLVWYENLGNNSFGTVNIISSMVFGSISVCSSDMDNDGDMDILSASYKDNKLLLFDNLGGNNFDLPQDLAATTNRPWAIKSADLDGDGDQDIIYVSSVDSISSGIDNKISWQENLGDGTFGFQKIISINANLPRDVQTADINGDGMIDIISASQYDDKIAWYENLGGGNFGSENIIALTADQARSVGVADIDGDGDMDVIAVYSYSKIYWYKNNGNGSSFTPQVLATDYSVQTLNPYDLDNDGDIDLLRTYGSGTFGWFSNNGTGTFGSSQLIGSSSSNSSTEAIASDLDNDGDLDIIGSIDDNKITWYENLGSGNFGTEQVLSSTLSSVGVFHTLDVDDDGDIDVIYASLSDKKIKWFENLGAGNFNIEKELSFFQATPSDLYSSDIDGDGDQDILSASASNDKISWYKNYFNNPKLSGTTFYDANQNSILDSNELGLPLMKTELLPNSLYSFSNSLGNYFFSTDTGTYTINYIQDSLWSLTTDSSAYTRDLNALNQAFDSLNFGFYPNSILTILHPELTGGMPRCNDTVNYWIDINNFGTTTPNGFIHLVLDSAISYVSSIITPDSINGQNIYWSYSTLFFQSDFKINLQVLMPTFTSMGDTLISTVIVYETDGLNNVIYSNTNSLKQVSICAYDPNDKTALPQGLGTEHYILNNQELEYLIRFQNTGSDTANTVTIRDYLDANLDWSTFQTLSNSHNVQFFIEQNGEAVFTFENIMLPDSGADYLGSQGFIKYKIDMKPNLTSETQITNVAEIYFDNNPAVTTNTELNTIYNCSSTQLNLTSNFICFNDSLSEIIPEEYFSNYLWEIDQFYFDSTNTLNWLADTAGTFNLNLTITNHFCSKDTSLSITVLPAIGVTNSNIKICQGDSIMVYGNYQSIAGVYYDSLQTINGCDSIFSTTLTINPLPTVSLANFNPDTLCVNANAVTLPTGSPSGGNYSGNGVIGGNFDPSSSGVGSHDVIYTYTDGNSCINSDTTIVTVDVCTGIDNVSTDFGIIIYPNPSTGQFTIEKPNDLSKEVQIKLLDATSKLILEKVIPIGKQKIEMDIRNYSKGIYYLQLIVDDEIFIKQILKN